MVALDTVKMEATPSPSATSKAEKNDEPQAPSLKKKSDEQTPAPTDDKPTEPGGIAKDTADAVKSYSTNVTTLGNPSPSNDTIRLTPLNNTSPETGNELTPVSQTLPTVDDSACVLPAETGPSLDNQSTAKELTVEQQALLNKSGAVYQLNESVTHVEAEFEAAMGQQGVVGDTVDAGKNLMNAASGSEAVEQTLQQTRNKLQELTEAVETGDPKFDQLYTELTGLAYDPNRPVIMADDPRLKQLEADRRLIEQTVTDVDAILEQSEEKIIWTFGLGFNEYDNHQKSLQGLLADPTVSGAEDSWLEPGGPNDLNTIIAEMQADGVDEAVIAQLETLRGPITRVHTYDNGLLNQSDEQINTYLGSQKTWTNVAINVGAGMIAAGAVALAPVTGGLSVVGVGALAGGVGAAGLTLADDATGGDYTTQDYFSNTLAGTVGGGSAGAAAALGGGVISFGTNKVGSSFVGRTAVTVAGEMTEGFVEGATSGFADGFTSSIMSGNNPTQAFFAGMQTGFQSAVGGAVTNGLLSGGFQGFRVLHENNPFMTPVVGFTAMPATLVPDSPPASSTVDVAGEKTPTTPDIDEALTEGVETTLPQSSGSFAAPEETDLSPVDVATSPSLEAIDPTLSAATVILPTNSQWADPGYRRQIQQQIVDDYIAENQPALQAAQLQVEETQHKINDLKAQSSELQQQIKLTSDPVERQRLIEQSITIRRQQTELDREVDRLSQEYQRLEQEFNLSISAVIEPARPIQDVVPNVSYSDIADPANLSIWSPGTSDNPWKNLVFHHGKHVEGKYGNLISGSEFMATDPALLPPEFHNIRTIEDYLRATHEFLTNPPAGTEMLVSPSGDIIYYNPVWDLKAVVDANGIPRTFYRRGGDIESSYQEFVIYNNR